MSAESSACGDETEVVSLTHWRSSGTHTYARSGPREVIIGNGGAPLSSAKSYGFELVERREDGAVQVDMRDYRSEKPDLDFRFAVNADGSPAPVSRRARRK